MLISVIFENIHGQSYLQAGLLPVHCDNVDALDLIQPDVEEPSVSCSTEHWKLFTSLYSCKFWNDMLSGPFLCDTGLLFSPAPGVTAVRPTMELSGINAYLGLMHWRRSQHFKHVDVVKFKLSRKESTRNIQLCCITGFFESFPGSYGERGFRDLHVFFHDGVTLVDGNLLLNIITLLHKTGCEDIWIYSSHFAELDILKFVGSDTGCSSRLKAIPRRLVSARGVLLFAANGHLH